MKENEVIEKAEKIRNTLIDTSDFENNRIDFDLPIIKPYIGSEKIKLVIIGQDPTVKNPKSRKNITTTLNLDKPNSLKKYIKFISENLGFTIDNVYATNIFKYFYSDPPAYTIDVLNHHLLPNLELLKEELEEYKDCIIITLGEPVLQLLTDNKAKVSGFWDYNLNTKNTEGKFKVCEAKNNKLKMDFYPFPHQPNIVKAFYKNTIDLYIDFVKNMKA